MLRAAADWIFQGRFCRKPLRPLLRGLTPFSPGTLRDRLNTGPFLTPTPPLLPIDMLLAVRSFFAASPPSHGLEIQPFSRLLRALPPDTRSSRGFRQGKSAYLRSSRPSIRNGPSPFLFHFSIPRKNSATVPGPTCEPVPGS